MKKLIWITFATVISKLYEMLTVASENLLLEIVLSQKIFMEDSKITLEKFLKAQQKQSIQSLTTLARCKA